LGVGCDHPQHGTGVVVAVRSSGSSGRGRKTGAPSSRGAGRTGPVKPAGKGSRNVRRDEPPKGGRPGHAGKPAGRGKGRATALGSARDKRSEERDDLGGTQVEGRQAVRELLIAGRRRVHEVWIANEREASEIVEDIVELARANRVPVVEVSRKKLDYAARSEAPQGVLARADALMPVSFDSLIKRRPGKPPFLVAVDGVTDPGNLGALLRCCDGAGVDGVVLPRHRAVHVTPTVAKTSVGACEHVPMALVGGLPTALTKMRDVGIWVVGLDDAADKSLFDLGELATEGICLVMGAEGAGLSRLVRERCDLIVSIPMRGRLSSLNVSTAAALATYEVARHRR
jgi:23S rRNA (guanosine2251-2'-O)-methyltransferase